MTTIWFICHPPTEVDRQVPIRDWALSLQGQCAAKRLLGKEFWPSVQALYSSTEPKAATVGGEVSCQQEIPLVQLEELCEVDRSSTLIVPLDRYMQRMERFYRRAQESMLGWETAEHAQGRVVECVRGLVDAHRNQVVAIIGHGATGTLLRCHVLGIEPSYSEDPKQTGCLMRIDWEGRQVSGWSQY